MGDDDDVRLLPAPCRPQDASLRLLWLSVLAAGVMEAEAALLPRRHARVAALDAWHSLRWVLADGVSVGSFVWVCTVLGLEAEAVRYRLWLRCGLDRQAAWRVACDGVPGAAAVAA